MSKFFRETFYGHGWRTVTVHNDFTDRDALDGRDPWDDEEITQIVNDFNRKTNGFHEDYQKDDYDPFSWLNPSCECGADTAKTTHTTYCPKYKGMGK